MKSAFISILIVISLFSLPLSSQVSINVTLDLNSTNDVNASYSNGEYSITTTGGDPFIYSNNISTIYDPDTVYIIEIEYFALEGLNDMKIYFNPINETNSASFGGLPIAEGWTSYTLNLKDKSDTWKDQYHHTLRFDFGTQAGQSIKVRNIKLRTITANEYDNWVNSPDKVNNSLLLAYYESEFHDSIKYVKVTPDSIFIKGIVSRIADEDLYLGEVRMHETVFNKTDFDFTVPVTSEDSFSIALPRITELSSGLNNDRLYSRWVIITPSASEANYELRSHARWADDIHEIADNYIDEDKPDSKKGMGGICNCSDQWYDLVDLGVHSMTYNIILPSLITLNQDELQHEFNGKIYYINSSALSRMDNALQFASDNNIQVSLILLIPYNQQGEIAEIFKHPDANGGIYTLANVVTETGVEYYTAIIDFLAKRYSRPDQKYGRITHWIIHNEIDAAPVWTNAGGKPQDLYMEQYDRSMRSVYYSVRRHDPFGKVFISLTHYWYKKHTYVIPEVLDRMTQISKLEGDYEWGVAYHPYPENLREPRTWEDNVTYDINSAELITPKNVELIDLWARTENNLYNNRKVRTILLSEQGINTKDYSRQQLDYQAAGVAYFWKRIKNLPSIEAFHYHRWIDHSLEGGLLMGLWSNYSGSVQDFDKKKPSWNIYRYAGTNHEDEAFEFTKPIIGISAWSTVTSSKVSPLIDPFRIEFKILYDGGALPDTEVMFNGEHKKTDASGTVNFYNVASLVNQTDIIIRTSDQLIDTFSIETDANKSIIIDVYSKSVSEEVLETDEVIDLEEPYVPFDYSAWFPNSTSEINETDSKIYYDRVHSKVYIEIAGPENYSNLSTVKLFDIQGREVKVNIQDEQNRYVIPYDNLTSGIYLIYTLNELHTRVYKILL